MNKYLVIYHAPPSFTQQMAAASPEEVGEEMGKWMEWAKNIGDSMVDMGNPLRSGMQVKKSGSSESKREVTGFSIVQANSMNEAIKLMDGHPHISRADSCEIEIHEYSPLPGQE